MDQPQPLQANRICDDIITHWEFKTPDGEIVSWIVYNSEEWLNYYREDPMYNRRIDNTGKIWEIDFKTNTIQRIIIKSYDQIQSEPDERS